MARITITADLMTGAHNCTGVVRGPLPDFALPATPGQARPPKVTAEGLYDFEAECIRVVQQFDQSRTEVYAVRIQAKQQPVLAAGPVTFANLEISINTTNGRTYWSATGVTAAQAARRGEAA
ncbi:MAG: hypothetical protein ACR2LF_10780 [Jatrophihabitantaceae bacterium]